MNYITEINEFYDWLETNALPKSAIALWHALMHIANKARWQETFAVAMSAIESKTGFSGRELRDARNILQQKGRIEWRQRGGSASAEYTIFSLCRHIAPANPPANQPTILRQTHRQTHHINKLDETLEEFVSEPPVPDVFSLSLDLQLPATVLEAAEYNQHTLTKEKNTEFIKKNWQIFLRERLNDPPGKKMNYRSIGDLTTYFLNWIRNKHPKNETTQRKLGSGHPASNQKNRGVDQLFDELEQLAGNPYPSGG